MVGSEAGLAAKGVKPFEGPGSAAEGLDPHHRNSRRAAGRPAIVRAFPKLDFAAALVGLSAQPSALARLLPLVPQSRHDQKGRRASSFRPMQAVGGVVGCAVPSSRTAAWELRPSRPMVFARAAGTSASDAVCKVQASALRPRLGRIGSQATGAARAAVAGRLFSGREGMETLRTALRGVEDVSAWNRGDAE